MSTTKIEWADKVWNPVTGCSQISSGCQNCYAERMAPRLKGRFGYDKDDPFKVTLHPDRLSKPSKWKKPKRIFVNSMGDLFHKDVRASFIETVFSYMWKSPQHTFLILTKRPERMQNFLSTEWWMECSPKSRKHIWLGVTAENQEQADKRIPILLDIPAAVRFVSVEPILESIDLLGPTLCGYPGQPCLECIDYIDCKGEEKKRCWLTKLDWIIAGKENGPKSRPCNPEWIKSLQNQCQETNVPFFLKGEYEGIEPIQELPK